MRQKSTVEQIHLINQAILNKMAKRMRTESTSEYIINDNTRYIIKIPSFTRTKDHILYEASIYDTAFMFQYTLFFRFKTLKGLHQQLIKRGIQKELPEFPKTKSVGFFWNRTNDNLPLIKERIRELQYYLFKLLNNYKLADYSEVKRLLKAIKRESTKRTRSELKLCLETDRNICQECPEQYNRELSIMNVL